MNITGRQQKMDEATKTINKTYIACLWHNHIFQAGWFCWMQEFGQDAEKEFAIGLTKILNTFS